MPPLPVEEVTQTERASFLRANGLDVSILREFGMPEHLAPLETMRDSHSFFSDLGGDTKRIFRDHPQLLTLRRDERLEPKLRFLFYEIGISKRTLVRLPKLFMYSLESMWDIYQHYVLAFGGNKQQARALLRDATTLFGNDTSSIDDKIEKYRKAGIDFHRNYTLLEIIPEKAVVTHAYLTELGIEAPQRGKWYHMLLAVSKEVLQPKVAYCEQEKINWRAYPRVLILGLEIRGKPGALPRRVDIIKQAFQSTTIPPALDYRINPRTLDNPDGILRHRLGNYV